MQNENDISIVNIIDNIMLKHDKMLIAKDFMDHLQRQRRRCRRAQDCPEVAPEVAVRPPLFRDLWRGQPLTAD